MYYFLFNANDIIGRNQSFYKNKISVILYARPSIKYYKKSAVRTDFFLHYELLNLQQKGLHQHKIPLVFRKKFLKKYYYKFSFIKYYFKFSFIKILL